MRNIPHIQIERGVFRKILRVPQNIVIDVNNVTAILCIDEGNYENIYTVHMNY